MREQEMRDEGQQRHVAREWLPQRYQDLLGINTDDSWSWEDHANAWDNVSHYEDERKNSHHCLRGNNPLGLRLNRYRRKPQMESAIK